MVIPDTRAIVRRRPLEALIIGAYVRGLSDRDIESLLKEAGPGACLEECGERALPRAAEPLSGPLRTRPLGHRPGRPLSRRRLPEDASPRPEGGRAGRLGVHPQRRAGAGRRSPRAQRALRGLARSRSDLAKRGLRAPWLAASDGAPGLVKAIEELWPAADRQRGTVYRLRNVLAKLTKAGHCCP